MALLRRALGSRNLVIGGGLLVLIAAATLGAPWLTGLSSAAQDLFHRRAPPVWYDWIWHTGRASWLHPLGTDKLGRDYWSRLLYGGRISLLIGTSAALISGVVGTALGMLGGYFQGRVDFAVSYIIATRLSMPVVLVALVVISVYGNSLVVVVAVISLLSWDRFAVVGRSLAQQLAGQDYVVAAEMLGCSSAHILLRQMLPNMTGPLVVVATLEMSNAILFEAALSFLGLGVPAPLPAWGLMLADAKDDIFFNTWMIVQPGLALFALVLAINLVGDGLRDLTGAEPR